MVKRYDAWLAYDASGAYVAIDEADDGCFVAHDDYAALEARLAQLEKDAALWAYVKSIHTDGWVSYLEDRASREA